MLRICTCVILATLLVFRSNGQTQAKEQDSLGALKNLPEVTLVGRKSQSDYQQMPEIVGTSIYAGKKNALIVMDNVMGNVANNTMRQVLGKVAGIHIWESDPSGIQIGIATRGLSPNRSWEFNIRQNGHDISADPFGYPEAYYNPQLDAVQRIEIIRGQGSLQYGPQFGGMVNYILRNGSDIDKKISLETRQTIGSNGLFNSFNSIGGRNNKMHYYAFFDHRNGNGWRDNSLFFTNAGFATVTLFLKPALSISAEFMQSHIRSRQPGGLTDSALKIEPQQSLRSRNWFDISWTTPAISLKYQLSDRLRWNTMLFAIVGNRNSVGFLKSINIPDSINHSTNQYNNRSLNIDQYRNYAIESRLLAEYGLLGRKHVLTAGIRLYSGQTWRRADGKGTSGVDYDMTVIGKYPRNIRFRSRNAAAFIENVFRAGKNLLIIPGLRYEWLEGSAQGINGINAAGEEERIQDVSRGRQFILAGLTAEYHLPGQTEIYAGWAQAYRPIQFANLQAAPTTDIIDPELKDARGYNLDAGFRGTVKKILQFDISGYYMLYDNRVGAISLPGAQRFITNIGASLSRGLESYVSINVLRTFKKNTSNEILLFGSYSYTDARYSLNLKDPGIKGKKVENAPDHIFRAGITVGFNRFSLTGQLNHTSSCFSDANNTLTPSANAQTGLIPAYRILDITAGWKFNENLILKAGINNLCNAFYFTRRAGGYPGPGALPGDGRNAFICIVGRL